MNKNKIDIKKMKEDYNNGKIIVCPRCGKIDIDPNTHFRRIYGFIECEIITLNKEDK